MTPQPGTWWESRKGGLFKVVGTAVHPEVPGVTFVLFRESEVAPLFALSPGDFLARFAPARFPPSSPPPPCPPPPTEGKDG